LHFTTLISREEVEIARHIPKEKPERMLVAVAN
jgi:hypothetical protein